MVFQVGGMLFCCEENDSGIGGFDRECLLGDAIECWTIVSENFVLRIAISILAGDGDFGVLL